MVMKTKKICLLIDDDDDDQLIFSTAINKYFPDYTFEKAYNFEETIQFISKINDDELSRLIIFLDLNMPKINGKECLTYFKKNERLKDLEIIIYSTSNNPTDKKECLVLGAKDFITKPSKISALVEELSVFLDKYEVTSR